MSHRFWVSCGSVLVCLAAGVAMAQQPGNGDPRVAALEAALGSGSASIRYQAVQAVGKLKEAGLLRRLLPSLVQRLADHHPAIQAEALQVLSQIALPQTTPVLVAALTHPAEQIRWLAARSLGDKGEASALAPLQKTLEDKAPAVRNEALAAIGKILDRIDRQRLTLPQE